MTEPQSTLGRDAADPASAHADDSAAPPSVSQPGGRRRGGPTRLSSLHVGLMTAALLLVLLVIFLAQNSHAVRLSFLGAHLRVSLAVAMLASAIAGALIMGAAGAARISQLRRRLRRSAGTRARR